MFFSSCFHELHFLLSLLATVSISPPLRSDTLGTAETSHHAGYCRCLRTVQKYHIQNIQRSGCCAGFYSGNGSCQSQRTGIPPVSRCSRGGSRRTCCARCTRSGAPQYRSADPQQTLHAQFRLSVYYEFYRPDLPLRLQSENL